MNTATRAFGFLLAGFLACPPPGLPRVGAAPAPSKSASAESAKWGEQTSGQIRAAFFMADRSLYAEDVGIARPHKPHPAWLWDASVQLAALCAAARVEPEKYLPRVKEYAAGLRAYRTHNHGVTGMDVNPPPKNPDRYYDDNAWAALSLLEAYELTRDPQDLKLATDAFTFAASGEDAVQGGGLYWREDNHKTKNACSCGPAMLDALVLHRITGNAEYLATGKRLYEWTRKRFQDDDGLIFDSMRVSDGRLNRSKFSYNSAAVCRAAVLLFQTTKERQYLDEAKRIAGAAEKQWVRKDGIIAGDGKFSHKLLEAFLALYDADHDPHWLQVTSRSVTALRDHRDKNGWYPQHWDAVPTTAIDPVRLIDQSSAARAYWLAAGHGVPSKP
ncbi:MAG TPA: glycoside hydrolase family 76 protein [Tepidisphaeraceae bacterium]|nr:glycoside hydrolase family 76 protein [Tepidisphaeraceae bacterium]